MVVAIEMKAVERCQQPQVDTGDPHQHCVLETLGQVRVRRVPSAIPVLQWKEKKILRQAQVNNGFDLDSRAHVQVDEPAVSAGRTGVCQNTLGLCTLLGKVESADMVS